jgi:hypothetical protein
VFWPGLAYPGTSATTGDLKLQNFENKKFGKRMAVQRSSTAFDAYNFLKYTRVFNVVHNVHELWSAATMKFLTLLLGSLVTASANAQYFSAGWAPGKAVPSSSATSSTVFNPPGSTPASKPKAEFPSLKDLTSMLDLTNILASGPVASLAARAGINITQKLADIKSHKFWDDRVTIIDDDNYEDIIVNEALTEKEEKDRVWFVIMYVLF